MNKGLSYKEYQDDIQLFQPYIPGFSDLETRDDLVEALLTELGEENRLSLSYSEKRRYLYGLINTLPPGTFPPSSVAVLDTLLQLELKDKSLTVPECHSLMALWQGDISTLKVDAIVNAANNQLLGCFQPWHKCIDNVIHSAAGVQLRDDCHTIMQKQGYPEPTGRAKITRAYNLPSRFVLHTVGPIVQGRVSREHRRDLTASYTSCLELCRQIETIRSLAFCCISTGVFGYPQEEAAEVAWQTVSSWLKVHPESLDQVVFNVFTDRDLDIYRALERA